MNSENFNDYRYFGYLYKGGVSIGIFKCSKTVRDDDLKQKLAVFEKYVELTPIIRS